MKRSVCLYGRRASGLICLLGIVFLSACASVPEAGSYDRPVTHTLTDTEDTALARTIGRAFPEQLAAGEESGFYPLDDGMKAFVARMALVDVAEVSVDVQYYIWHPDTSGTLLAGKLLDAADRGVRVRLLLDDLDTAGKDTFLVQLDAHPNIEVRLYNPFAYRGSRGVGFAGDLKRLNHRMHNKSLTVDNQAAIVGGRNIGNEYFDAVAHTAFADLDVLAIGPVVPRVSGMFDQYWNSEVAVPVGVVVTGVDISPSNLAEARGNFQARIDSAWQSDYVKAVQASKVLDELRFANLGIAWGRAQLLYDDPEKLLHPEITGETHLAPQLLPVVAGASQRVAVVSPYFVPGEATVELFRELVARGVEVSILTNSLAANDVGVVHAGYMRYRKALLEGGVHLYEYKPEPTQVSRNKNWTGSSSASLHAKTLGADGRHVFVGSFNLDPRSVALNTEMGVMIENPVLASGLHEGFHRLARNQAYRVELVDGQLRWTEILAGGELRTYDVEPQTTLWQRFVARTLSIIVPESML
ncbi:phospholipase D family protein [Parahaliea maris]|uniref:Phospholipase D family protein n=1 Tax=Parahaliea maris TaxID=2716870 RepID=A0A5C9A6L2_9GAMM|nr:phospholipase D family protein [Parahaliea maris]TXS95709.1 phospholipase D family protein [Parahaliea maris]